MIKKFTLIPDLDLLEVAFIIEANDHLSALRRRLKKQAENRAEALCKILLMLKLTPEEFEKLYDEEHKT